TFNNHLLVFYRLQLREDLLGVLLHFGDFWVQIHDLLVRLMFEGMARQFGGFLGSFVDFDARFLVSNYGGLCEFRFGSTLSAPEMTIEDHFSFFQVIGNHDRMKALQRVNLDGIRHDEYERDRNGDLVNPFTSEEGLGNPRAIQRLRYMLREMNPDVAFFMEKTYKKLGCIVSLYSFSKSHIDVQIDDDMDGYSWCFTGFYGDFIKITFSSEKQCGRLQDERSMEAFHSTLQDCGLFDLHFIDQWYTWEWGRFVQ
ncbi:hypothetical protein Gotri_021139, partial [Gossypium trilobum]|nr:hypothetical protein [Gossypium trilobum]